MAKKIDRSPAAVALAKALLEDGIIKSAFSALSCTFPAVLWKKQEERDRTACFIGSFALCLNFGQRD